MTARPVMIRRTAFRPAAAARGLTLTLGLLLACAVAAATEPGVSLPMTRAELQRTWDLDRNGVIDVAEAAMAASKMRQDRARIGQRRIVDPVTGRLLDDTRTDASPALPAAGAPSWLEGEPAPRRSASREWFERWSLETAEAEPAEPAADSGAAPSSDSPLSRSGGLRLHGPIPGRTTLPTTNASVPVAARRGGVGGERGTEDRPAGGGALPAAARLWPTGGLRAGAEPARPGYGSGVTRDLNAGRPIDRTAGAGGRAPATTGAALRVPAGPGRAVPGGATAPRAASGGRTPGRPYDPY
jgi:hypothetical protein